ncbi:MAG: nuclear transport factor 2 family protein [Inconstantimicrobium porci]|uniref:nuclear transport factor 2 family protein n=1 Tax=Inconstantimicrobium porci TaxID=2652291 RepID=UPI00197EFCD6|nr:nuclear transport factor 2 family protein [Inconstantimicrobium porci]MDD6769477.1 nuclear transport factor 2 family protein [Inconstantimicrobium porci]MDY5911915.1 nuclear transport factor 2 family protein [Inconstantimicrobium porci]
MNLRESIIYHYFDAWIDNDSSILNDIFDDSIIYSECYGPEYHGVKQVKMWFSDWHAHGKVLRWDIKRFMHDGMSTIVEWYFECDYNKKIDGFDGVSIIEFTDDNRIKSVKEFESKKEHIYPYGK